MILLELFISFFKIGAFTFGGGYAMISIIRETVIAKSWMTEDELLKMIAVAESTPGPIAVNMATFVGYSQSGILGSIFATLGVVLPSFLVILIISAFIGDFLKYSGVNAFLGGVRPCVVAMIISTSITLFLSSVFSLKSVTDTPAVDWRGIVILLILASVHLVHKKIRRKKPSPIAMIALSAFLGGILYAV